MIVVTTPPVKQRKRQTPIDSKSCFSRSKLQDDTIPIPKSESSGYIIAFITPRPRRLKIVIQKRDCRIEPSPIKDSKDAQEIDAENLDETISKFDSNSTCHPGRF